MANQLTPEQHTFALSSVLPLRQVYSEGVASQMRNQVWEHLERRGIASADAATWLPERFRGFGELRRELPLSRLRTPALRAALDSLMGRGKWEFPTRAGLLVGPPESPRRPWKVARRDWHWDAGHAGPWTPSEGLLLWCPLTSMPPRCGGTLLLEGSRSLLGDYMAEREASGEWSTADGFKTWHPYLRRLYGVDPANDPDDFLAPYVDETGRTLRVTEVTGEPGDVVITDVDVVHRIPQHHGTAPRILMLLRVAQR